MPSVTLCRLKGPIDFQPRGNGGSNRTNGRTAVHGRLLSGRTEQIPASLPVNSEDEDSLRPFLPEAVR